MDWLLAMNPLQRASHGEHYATGLHLVSFE